MRFKLKRIAIASVATGMLLVGFNRDGDMRDWLSRVLPVDGEVSGEAVNAEAFWSARGHPVQELEWHGGQGWVPGRVGLEKWQAGDRVFYRIRGPAPPQGIVDDQADRLPESDGTSEVFCEVLFKTDFGCEVRKFSAAGTAVSLWRSGDRVAAAAAVPAFEYRIAPDGGYVTLTFWTPVDEPVGNIVFRYREHGLSGWVSTDRSKSSRYDIEQWTWP